MPRTGTRMGRGRGRAGGGGCRGRGRGRGGVLEPAILAALVHEDAHGYGVVQAVDEMTDGFICADPGGAYRTLRRLEDDGCVVSDWVEGDSGPQRRLYRITEEGRALLVWWIEDLRVRAQAFGAIADVAEKALDEKKV